MLIMMKQHSRTTKRKTQTWLSKSDSHQPKKVKLTLMSHIFADGFCIEDRCVEKKWKGCWVLTVLRLLRL